MKFYDLFAGIGGFRLGLEANGHECVGSCEIDRHARTIYGKNFGSEPEASNALKLDAREMPDFDILCAGFPCQTFSTAGNKLGFKDTRGTLFFEIARIARQKRPRLLFLENVTGLLSHDEGRTFGTILAALDELGYDAEWQVVNGKYFLPQNRERVFIIGHPREKPSKQVLPVGEYGEALADGQEGRGATVVRALTAGGHSGGLHSNMTVISSGLWQSRGFQTRKDDVSHCLKGQGGSAGNFIMLSHTKANIKQRQQERLNTWTIDTSGGKMGIMEGERIRRLTPTECERLQGFPDGWTEGVSDTARYRLLGNAVMPPVVSYIGRHLA